MSYMRSGYPLKYFKGKSKSYVFPSSYKKGKKWIDYICDYNDKYEDNCSFIELLANIIQDEVKDEEYTFKIVKMLAKKLKVENRLRRRNKPISEEEYFRLAVDDIRKFQKSKWYKKITKGMKKI